MVTPYQLEVLQYFSGSHLFNEFPKKEALCRPASVCNPAKIKSGNEEETRGQVWLRSKVIGEKYGEYTGWFDRWVTRMHNQPPSVQAEEAAAVYKMISDTNYAQTVMSGIAGFYDRYPRIPYGRACGYNEKEPELFAKSFPYLRKLNKIFKQELPGRWAAQNECVQQLDPKFVIDKTVFTTLTINHNWRTAGHRDAGDLSRGFSNISGIGRGWKGYVFCLPEWKIGINLQPGDLLLVANHEGIHTNTAPIGDDNDRVSIVAYFREKMLNLGSWEYENLRKQFVEDRRADHSHPFHRPLWNGVSPGMWSSQEWADYLAKHNMVDEDGVLTNNLESFFG